MTDKMTQKSHEDMSKEINKDGVAVRTRGYHIWRVIFCIIGVLGMLMFIYPVFRGCHVNIGTLLGTGVFALLTLYGVFRAKIDKSVRKLWDKSRKDMLKFRACACNHCACPCCGHHLSHGLCGSCKA